MFSFDKLKDSVVITGGTGFLGKHVIRELVNRGYQRITSISRNPPNTTHRQYLASYWFNGASVEHMKMDLTKYDFKRVFNRYSNHYVSNTKAVINLAASVGGIGANQKHSAKFMMDTLKIGINVVEAIKSTSVMKNSGKLVQIGTVCAYPKYTPVPFKETDLWNGYPEETNAAYGIAKKTIMELVMQYNMDYKTFNGINLIPVNLYGPGDNFDLQNSHVIPALIRKFETARKFNDPYVESWGTGKASREFLFVQDAARGIVDAMENYEGLEPVNLGTGQEITMYNLAYLIKDLTGYPGNIVFNTTKPDGQPRRCLDVSKAKTLFGFEATTQFSDGLMETIKWYRENEQWLTQ